MAVRHGYGKIAGTDALVFAYDTGDTVNSFKGEPTTNYVPGTYSYDLYAYASGPVDTTVLNEKNKSVTVKRYTITQAVNTARAAIFPTGLTTGVAYTFSFKWRYNGTTTASPSIGVTASKGNPEGGANNNSFTSQEVDTVPIGNSWYLTTYTFIFSSVPTSACKLTFGISTGSTAGYVGETFDIYEAQFEIKNHRTQYSNGTRSATQGLLDLTGNSIININNASFSSTAAKTFDGTDDYIDSGYDFSWNNLNAASVELLLKPNTISGGDYGIIGKEYPNWEWAFYQNGTSLSLVYWNTSGGHTNGMDFSITAFPTANIWYHITYTWDKTTSIFYVNGVNVGSQTASNPSINQNRTNNVMIGGHTYVWGDRYWSGQIDVTKFYNRALTADEVRNNYRHYKTRYKI